MNPPLQSGDKILLLCKASTSIEQVVRQSREKAFTTCIDVNISDGPLREYVLGMATTALGKARLEWFAEPATINLSNHGSHVVVGVYYRP